MYKRKKHRPWNRKKKRKFKEAKDDNDDNDDYDTTDNADHCENTSYEIKSITRKVKKIKQPKASEKGILPEHPFRMYIVGASGSGKSNLVLNLLSLKKFYSGYFDNIVVISPTALSVDTSYQVLNLSSDNFFKPSVDVLESLRDLQEKRIEEAKGNKNKVKKMLIIFDDIVSHKSFCNSPIFLQFAVMSRHWNVSIMVLSQAYHRIPKSVRLQMSSLIFFKGSNKELDVLTEDFNAPGLSSKQFKNIVANSTKKRYDFFFIDIHRPIGEGRYRKNLTEEVIK